MRVKDELGEEHDHPEVHSVLDVVEDAAARDEVPAVDTELEAMRCRLEVRGQCAVHHHRPLHDVEIFIAVKIAPWSSR